MEGKRAQQEGNHQVPRQLPTVAPAGLFRQPSADTSEDSRHDRLANEVGHGPVGTPGGMRKQRPTYGTPSDRDIEEDAVHRAHLVLEPIGPILQDSHTGNRGVATRMNS